jgi:Tfp pilus assembly protein PilF
MANGDRTGARTALNAAKAAAPQSHEADLLLAQLDMLDNKPDDAAARLRVVVSSDPRNSAAYLLLGVLAETKGDHSAAEADYRRAIEGDPHNAAALNNLAFELSEYDKKAAEALPFAQQAKELAPDRPEFADTLGWILYRKGLYDSAVRQLESAAAQKEASVTIRYHLAMAYLKMGDRVRGKAALEAALKQNPNVPEAESAKEMLARTK